MPFARIQINVKSLATRQGPEEVAMTPEDVAKPWR